MHDMHEACNLKCVLIGLAVLMLAQFMKLTYFINACLQCWCHQQCSNNGQVSTFVVSHLGFV